MDEITVLILDPRVQAPLYLTAEALIGSELFFFDTPGEKETFVFKLIDTAISKFGKKKVDAIILAGNIKDYPETVKSIRRVFDVPLIALISAARAGEIPQFLIAGGDDVLTAPVDKNELIAHIRSLLKRRSVPQLICVGDLTLDTIKKEGSRRGYVFSLTDTEFKLLYLLMSSSPNVVQRDAIYETVWNLDYGEVSNIVEVYIRYLRQKTENRGEFPRLIQTERGVGYVLRTPQ